LSGEIAMALSVGIDFDENNWKICMLEHGEVLELRSFVSSSAALAYVEHYCVLYPELTIVAATAGFESPFTPLHTLGILPSAEIDADSEAEQQAFGAKDFLIAVGNMNLNSYNAPSVKYLPTVSLHRKLMRPHLGASNSLCATAALLYGLRKREAVWPEMRFLCVKVDQDTKSVLVVEDGRIVNGISDMPGGMGALMNGVPGYGNESFPNEEDGREFKAQELEHRGEAKNVVHASEQAFWEGLTQELAGLMAIHHLEDVVVTGENKAALIERFADSYQVYLFPYSELDVEGYESALGAAVIAEGLYAPGLTSEVVERLQVREASMRVVSMSGDQER
jgi:predicted butyrate kinase (DUF1464 family)